MSARVYSLFSYGPLNVSIAIQRLIVAVLLLVLVSSPFSVATRVLVVEVSSTSLMATRACLFVGFIWSVLVVTRDTRLISVLCFLFLTRPRSYDSGMCVWFLLPSAFLIAKTRMFCLWVDPSCFVPFLNVPILNGNTNLDLIFFFSLPSTAISVSSWRTRPSAAQSVGAPPQTRAPWTTSR